MKKYLLTIILFILIIPTIVIAGSCNPNDIEIKTVTLSKVMGNATEVTAASIDNKTLDLDVKLYDPNDYMEYTITVKNNGTEDYYIKEEDLNNDQYHKYEFVHENDSYKIEPNEEKEITLRVSYIDRVEGNANYVSTDTISLNVLSNQTVQVANTIKNISVGFVILIIIMIILIFSGVITISHNSKKLLMIIVTLALFIPLTINAACESTIDVDVKVELDNKNAVFDNGVNIVYKLKALSGTTINSQYGYYTRDINVTAIKRSTTEPTSSNKEDKNLVSAPSSSYPIYMWYENGTIWWWSEDETPSLNEDAQAMFASFENLVDIDDFKYFDTSNCINFASFLNCALTLESIEALRNWNVSNAVIFEDIFDCVEKVTDFSPISNWDVSNVKNLSWAFCCANGITSLADLANWNLPKLEEIEGIFCYAENLEDISVLASWDVSEVTNFSEVFEGCYSLKDLSPISQWDTSNATVMYGVFMETTIEDYSPITNWDVSKVENMEYIFSYNDANTNFNFLLNWTTSSLTNLGGAFSHTAIENLNGLRNLDVSKVTSLNCLFKDCASLTSLEGIEDWNVSKVKDMAKMLMNVTLLTSIEPIEGWTTTKVETMESTFENMTSLESADLRNWSVSNLKYLYRTFVTCTALTEVDITGWTTTNLISLDSTFDQCRSLTVIRGIEYINTSNVTKYNRTFFYCRSLKSLDLHRWNTGSATSMSSMFYYCLALETFDVSGWDTSKVTDMGYMFKSLQITELDISSFNTKKVKKFLQMFYDMPNITTIYIGENWDTSANTNATSPVFPNSCHLTNFDSNDSTRQDLSWAKPTTQGGYLTLKTNS